MTVADIAEQLESALASDDAETYHLRQACQLVDCEAGDAAQLTALRSHLTRALEREPGERTPLLREAVGMLAEYRATGTISGDGAIPAPFDAIPTIEMPTEEERERARRRYPPEAVPDDGAIPDPHHQVGVPVEITVPAWALEATRWRWTSFGHNSESPVTSWVQEYVYPDPRFVTERGEDIATLLGEPDTGDS